VLCACIDIGSNTTRVLVADVRAGDLTARLNQRAFTLAGRDLRAGGSLSRSTIDQIAAVVGEQARAAERAGASSMRAVATAAIRGATNRDELLAAVRERAGVGVDVLDAEEEARLAFRGATATLEQRPTGPVAVVDVGGGSTEVAVGTLEGGVTWWASYAVGSGVLTDRHCAADPPDAASLAAMRAEAFDALGDLALPQPVQAVAVGGSAASMRRLVGDAIEPRAVARGLELVCGAPAAEVARASGLEEERIRLLPAGLVLLSACAAALGGSLQIGRGGLREGVCLELAAVH
jgi:exopolyphosphatase / guanosine-5'-triphosphate,3'-diphosphate pyrophosphatase